MPYLLIRHKIEDFSKWKPVFDEHTSARQAAGSKGGHLFLNIDDNNEIVILLEVDDVEKTRQFMQSDDLREAMQQSGVADEPDVYFLDEVDKPSA